MAAESERERKRHIKEETLTKKRQASKNAASLDQSLFVSLY